MKRRTKRIRQSGPPAQKKVGRSPESEVRLFESRKNVKSTKWKRSYISLIPALAFLLLALWYLISQKK